MRKWCCGLHQMQVLASQGADCCHRHPCHTPAATHPHHHHTNSTHAAHPSHIPASSLPQQHHTTATPPPPPRHTLANPPGLCRRAECCDFDANCTTFKYMLHGLCCGGCAALKVVGAQRGSVLNLKNLGFFVWYTRLEKEALKQGVNKMIPLFLPLFLRRRSALVAVYHRAPTQRGILQTNFAIFKQIP